MKHLRRINEIMDEDVYGYSELSDIDVIKCELCGNEFDDVDLDLYIIYGKDVMCCKYCREKLI